MADLAAAGLTNPEIAARLFMSRKTVEFNLGKVYRKLGVRGRTELAVHASNSGDLPVPNAHSLRSIARTGPIRRCVRRRSLTKAEQASGFTSARRW